MSLVYMCESLVHMQECFLLSVSVNVDPAHPSCLAVSSFLASSTGRYTMCVFVSFLLRMSAPRGQNSVYFVHSTVPSANNVLGTSRALNIIVLSE